MKKLISTGMTRSGILISIAILVLGTALTATLLIYGQVAEAFLAFFISILGVLVTVLFSRIAINLGVLKQMCRAIDRVINGSTEPILRDIHRQLMDITGDKSRAFLSVSTSDSDAGSRKDLKEIKRLLMERDDLENQVLRQIVAETRLLRIAVEREES